MAIYFLENTDWNCDGIVGRRFYEFPFALYRPSTEKHVASLDELNNIQFRNLNDPWMLTFSYAGYDFFVDSHSHGSTTTFIVAQPDCPDEILLQIIGLFAETMRIAADYKPSHPDLIASPDAGNARNLSLRWGMRIFATVFLCFAIHCFFDGNHKNAVGFGTGTVFLAVVSFCSDFASKNTY